MQVKPDTSVQYLKGVGPERSKLLARLGIGTVGDLFYFFPRRYENRSPVKRPGDLLFLEKECVEAPILSARVVRTRGGPAFFRVVLKDESGELGANWFNMPYLSRALVAGARLRLYGKAEKKGRRAEMIHPEYELVGEGSSVHSGRIVPVYPLTEDLGQKGLRQLMHRATSDLLRLIRDPLPYALRRRLGLVDRVFALRQIHFPDSTRDLQAAYRRLVFDEFFSMQLFVQLKKAEIQKENPEITHAGGDAHVRELVRSLGFDLTAGQRSAIQAVLSDMKRGRPMNRLLQGDVGSGKTVIAAAGLVFTASNGFQGALMAPTEVLAQQHYYTVSRLLEPLGVSCAYLAQNLTPEEKKSVHQGVENGSTKVVIGTHALIQSGLRFKKLGLAVIDEQHKFGVLQRAALRSKGADVPPHVLLMTATPIPRTLAMTLYGDLDITSITEMPKGRKTVKTLWVGENKRADVYRMIGELVGQGRQAYVICPLIEEGDGASLKSVSAAHAELSKVFSGHRVGLLHGRMKGDAKKKVMQDFKRGELQILVSTVVIEVGVDVPNATVMVIENAEKFGLAQLHQLRGRVGRGDEESACILFSEAAGEEAAERLAAFESTASGFQIAEKDLRLRGGGDIAGRRQHGLPDLKIGHFVKDRGLLEIARSEADRAVGKDPDLKTASSAPFRRILDERYGRRSGEEAVSA